MRSLLKTKPCETNETFATNLKGRSLKQETEICQIDVSDFSYQEHKISVTVNEHVSAHPDGAADESISIVDLQHSLEQLGPGRLILSIHSFQQVHWL